MSVSKNKQSRECSEWVETENSSRSLGEVDVEVTSTGKYQCRFCGLVFETLEAHDRHYREVHGQSSSYLSSQVQS